VVSSTTGSSQSAFGYTGESYGDSTQLLYLRARHYAPGTGRFLTRDTWGGDYYQPMSYNQWNYTLSNPINFTDPSGNVPCHMLPPEDQVNCVASPAPNTRGYNEKIPPRNITWYPSQNPYLMGATGIPRNTNGSQRIDQNYGLCGVVALSAITGLSVQSIIRLYVELQSQGFINSGTDIPPNFQGPGTLVEIVNNGIAGGWTAEGLYWTNFLRDSNGNQLSYPANKRQQANLIYQLLSQGKHPVAGVEILSGSFAAENADISGKIASTNRSKANKITHWVVISGVSNEWSKTNGFYNNNDSPWNWVRVFNPFDNQTEYYWWKDFRDAWDAAGGMLVVVSRGYEP
jgi:RHS repeat-associated protein